MKILAIIPARSGSKGIPSKNTLKFFGKTLISYSCESAIESKLINEIIVTSDCKNILDLCSKYREVKTHERSKQLSSDNSPIVDTIKEIISIKKLNDHDIIILLQPTAPLRTGKQIDQALEMILDNPDFNSVISLVRMDDVHPARMYDLNPSNNLITPFLKEFSEYRRQDIPPLYYRNGSIYISKVKTIIKYNTIMKEPSIGFNMNNKDWLNIDDKRDLIIANSLIENWLNEKRKSDSF